MIYKLQDAAGVSFEFKDIQSLSAFIKNEIKDWSEQEVRLENHKITEPIQYLKPINWLNRLRTMIDIVESNKEETAPHLRSQNETALVNQLKVASNQWLKSNTHTAKRLFELNSHFDKDTANGFLNFISKKQIGDISRSGNYSQLVGNLFGFEFIRNTLKLETIERSEDIYIDSLRKRLLERTNETITEATERSNEHDLWIEKVSADWKNWFDETDAYSENGIRDAEDRFNIFVNECTQRISALESAYGEKLRLEEPAKYWRNAASGYHKNGNFWAIVLGLTLSAGLLSLATLFTLWIKGWQPIPFQLSSIQGIIIFGAFLATYAYAVRSISRLLFSSFHLMRDSQEREQLTHVYLALIKDQAMDESSRDIVLQSLFSRTETGLLAEEHGPAMPGMSDVVRAMPKTK